MTENILNFLLSYFEEKNIFYQKVSSGFGYKILTL